MSRLPSPVSGVYSTEFMLRESWDDYHEESFDSIFELHVGEVAVEEERELMT